MTGISRATDPDEITAILEARAAELAKPTGADEGRGETVTLIVVALGGERYGIDIERVREITPFGEVTPLPATPPFWLGLVNLRGHLFPVLDLGRYLGQRIDATERADAQIVLVAGHGLTIGLRVDEVREVRTLPTEAIGPSLVEASSDRPHVHAGLTRDLLAVLDMTSLLSDAALIVQDGLD